MSKAALLAPALFTCINANATQLAQLELSMFQTYANQILVLLTAVSITIAFHALLPIFLPTDPLTLMAKSNKSQSHNHRFLIIQAHQLQLIEWSAF